MTPSNQRFIAAAFFLSACMVPSSSMPMPTTAAEESSTPHNTETPADVLERLCGQKPLVTGDIVLTPTMKSAAVKVLEAMAKKNPNEGIQQCVVSIPADGNVDEEIQAFNDGRHWAEKYNTTFLLFGKGVRPDRIDPGKPCEWSASKTTGDALPAPWKDTFWIKNTINLESGQKLVGIPLSDSDSQLANGYYVNIQRRLNATGRCSGDMAAFTIKKDSLITLEGAGNTITGLTNINHFDQIETFTQICSLRWSSKTHRKTLNAQNIHFEVIKARFNPMALPVNNHSSIIDIFNNQFFQYEKPAVDISLKTNPMQGGQEELASGRLAENTLIRIHNNHFYSCQVAGVEKKMDPAVKVDVDFNDVSPNPKTVHALSVKQNHFLADGNLPVSFKLASNAMAIINDNQLNATESGNSLYGMELSGISDINKAALSSVTASFNLANNLIKGFRVALALNPKLALHLESNRLLGTSAVVELKDRQIFDVVLSGDNNNEYLKSAEYPCGNLDQGNIQGGIEFSDGTFCLSSQPSSPKWTPTLKPTPILTSSPVTTVSKYSSNYSLPITKHLPTPTRNGQSTFFTKQLTKQASLTEQPKHLSSDQLTRSVKPTPTIPVSTTVGEVGSTLNDTSRQQTHFRPTGNEPDVASGEQDSGDSGDSGLGEGTMTGIIVAGLFFMITAMGVGNYIWHKIRARTAYRNLNGDISLSQFSSK